MIGDAAFQTRHSTEYVMVKASAAGEEHQSEKNRIEAICSQERVEAVVRAIVRESRLPHRRQRVAQGDAGIVVRGYPDGQLPVRQQVAILEDKVMVGPTEGHV